MRSAWSERWRQSVHGVPGRRFRDRYARTHRHPSRRQWFTRLARMVAAVVAIAIGLVLAVIPGPAVLFFLVAGILLASEWLWVARLLDWLEVRLRRVAQAARRGWRRLPRYGRVVLIAAAATASAASTWGLYQLVR